VQHESNHVGLDTDEQCHGNGQADQLQRGVGRSIRPRTTVPPTVLMTELDTGTLILQGRPDGPRVHLCPAEAVPLRRELAAAFRRTQLELRGDQDDAR
jgi:hypothetical protein